MIFSPFRPEDYFAEMAKTDEHMQKVRKNLLAKQAAQARTEKVRQLRDQKKIAKRVQVIISYPALGIKLLLHVEKYISNKDTYQWS